jgi:propionyl-CoA carboxylase alpha chain
VALAAFVRRKARERAAGISGQLPGHEVGHQNEMVVVQLGEKGQHVHHPVTLGYFNPSLGTVDVTVDGSKTYTIQSHTKLGDVLMVGKVNGQPFAAQVERSSAKQPLALRVSHNGTAIDAMVLPPRAAELLKLMPYKAPPDLSKFLLSPMPGLLADVPVSVGQKVLAGEKLAVIEAMKMENILVATQDCVVKEIRAQKGESLSVDQAILSFE